MSVKVNSLTKKYGAQHAVDDVSFEAQSGEVLGFLGPNGAGKTTTMKILTCFIPQTEGTVTVCGYDTSEEPMKVRERIGYLPEHNPLYKDMYVREYLNFVAGLHKLPNKQQRIHQMIELTGLEREQKKLIGALSKGYRQRVGLAQAMLHDPEVLILDEPTSGLDPNQLVDIRALIKEIGKSKTVIFSTHIMQEVQAICDRVLIINRGKLVANDTIDDLRRRVSGETAITIQFLEKIGKAQLQHIPDVTRIEALTDNSSTQQLVNSSTPQPDNSSKWQIITDKKYDIRPKIFKFAVENGLTLIEMRQDVQSVEDVFQQLTRVTSSE